MDTAARLPDLRREAGGYLLGDSGQAMREVLCALVKMDAEPRRLQRLEIEAGIVAGRLPEGRGGQRDAGEREGERGVSRPLRA